MKRLFLIVIISLISFPGKCQIQIQEIATLEKNNSKLTYDVNKNIQYHENLDAYTQYVGLDIVFLPKNKQYFMYKDEATINDCFYELNENNILIPMKVKPDDILGKTFKIIDFKKLKPMVILNLLVLTELKMDILFYKK